MAGIDREIILVTGGAGFIGSHTVEHLLERGCRVRVLDNLSSGKRENLPLTHPHLELIVGDATDADDVGAVMRGAKRCLHLAAQVSVERSLQDPAESCRQNILAFVNVLEAARREGIRRFVYASSAAVYGAPKKLPLDETTPPDPISPYGLEKQVDEQYARLFARLYGLSSLGLRYFNVYGPRQDPSSPYAGVISIFISRLAQGLPLTIHGDGEQSRDFIEVADVARANVAALFSDAAGVCNVATGASMTLLQLVRHLEAFAGHAELRFEAPRRGDIRASAANVERMQAWLDIRAETPPEQGLRRLWDVCVAERSLR